MSISDQSFIKRFSSSIKCKDDGIYYADSPETISYPDKGNDNCFEIEENSFWFRHRNNCIIEMVKKFPPIQKGSIFDIGGGNGFVSIGLINAGFDIVLVEPGSSGARNAKKRGITHVVCATSQSAKFKHGTLPAIGVFDVVEHIEDDVGFLNHLFELLVPGGMLYLTVPAYKSLWSHEDINAGHFRRYTLSNLISRMGKSGFKVLYSSYIFAYLPFFVFFLRTIPYKLNLIRSTASRSIKKDHSSPDGIGSKILNYLHKWELNKIVGRKTIPFGGSCMVTAKKPI